MHYYYFLCFLISTYLYNTGEVTAVTALMPVICANYCKQLFILYSVKPRMFKIYQGAFQEFVSTHST